MDDNPNLNVRILKLRKPVRPFGPRPPKIDFFRPFEGLRNLKEKYFLFEFIVIYKVNENTLCSIYEISKEKVA
jgi:hypothetical protein